MNQANDYLDNLDHQWGYQMPLKIEKSAWLFLRKGQFLSARSIRALIGLAFLVRSVWSFAQDNRISTQNEVLSVSMCQASVSKHE